MQTEALITRTSFHLLLRHRAGTCTGGTDSLGHSWESRCNGGETPRTPGGAVRATTTRGKNKSFRQQSGQSFILDLGLGLQPLQHEAGHRSLNKLPEMGISVEVAGPELLRPDKNPPGSASEQKRPHQGFCRSRTTEETTGPLGCFINAESLFYGGDKSKRLTRGRLVNYTTP